MLDTVDVTIGYDPEELETKPDLLVWRVDQRLQADRLAAIASSTPTLVLAMAEDLIPAVDAGCMGFLSHHASLHEIKEAAMTVLSGGAVVPPDLLGRLLQHLVHRRRSLNRVVGLDTLTPREREVYQLAVEGLRKEEIGERLFISPGTARTHLQRMYRKLGVHSQAELMALANQGALDEDGDH